MANGISGSVHPQLQRIFRGETLAARTDGQLLERFAARNDEAAFEALMARYGPLVLTVCRNLLRDRDDVDDAFQATFLVLVRKARSIRLDDSLGPWIYAVAYRVAHRVRANRSLQNQREGPAADLDPEARPDDQDAHDVAPLLHDELARLPERLRAPLVLCYFRGLTHEMAAEQLQWPVGTVRSRMARGRARLRDRLTRRGVVLSAGFLTASALRATATVVPQALAEQTVRAAMRVAAGRAAIAGVVTTQVAALMEGALNAMWLTQMKAAAAAALLAGFVLTGMVAIAVQPPGNEPGQAVPANRPPGGTTDQPPRASSPKDTLKTDEGTSGKLGLEELLARWEKHGAVRSLEVTFSLRERFSKRETKEYEGRFLRKSPDRSLIELDRVKGQTRDPLVRMVRNRDHIYQYFPASKQILVFKIPQRPRTDPRESLATLGLKSWLRVRQVYALSDFLSGESLPFLFAMQAAEAKRKFAIDLIKETADSAVLRVTLLDPGKQGWFQYGLVQLDKNRYLPSATTIVDRNNKVEKTVQFKSITVDGPMEDSLFEFNPPKGWKVIQKDDEFDRDEQWLMKNARYFDFPIGAIY